MLILIGVVPGAFALRMSTDEIAIHRISSESQLVTSAFQHAAATAAPTPPDPVSDVSSYLKEGGSSKTVVPYSALAELNQTVSLKLSNIRTFSDLSGPDRRSLRTDVFLVGAGLGKLIKSKQVTDPATLKAFSDYKADLDALTMYIPIRVTFAVAIALGLGTMTGWKRIVVTVGEKDRQGTPHVCSGGLGRACCDVHRLGAD